MLRSPEKVVLNVWATAAGVSVAPSRDRSNSSRSRGRRRTRRRRRRRKRLSDARRPLGDYSISKG